MILLYTIGRFGPALVFGVASDRQDCGFSDHRLTLISHFDKTACGWPRSRLPSGGKEKSLERHGSDQILVDVRGRIVKTSRAYFGQTRTSRIADDRVSKADGRPLKNVTFAVRGPSDDRTITRGRTDHNGRFRLKPVPPGGYLFKATANGFQLVVRTVVVVFQKPTSIKIEVPTGV